jgi:hypothetical protein
MGAMGRTGSACTPVGRYYESRPVAQVRQTRYIAPMILRASPHRVSADLGWRWWPLAVVAPAHSLAKEMPRESACTATATIPAIGR